VKRKRPELFANNWWILHQDNASAHTALYVREFLANKQITVLEHPPYSQDLAPYDFFLFPKIKEILTGRHSDDNEDMTSNTTVALKTIPQNQFQYCFEGWTRRWHQCIASQGDYFEGDHSDIQQRLSNTFTAMSSRTLLSDHVHLIYWGGTNDIAQSNKPSGIKHIHHHFSENRHTNITFMGVPQR
jgi:transposase